MSLADPADPVDAGRRRHSLAAQLVASGDLHSAGWRAAFEAVPRHAFLPEFFIAENPPDGSPSIYHAVSAARSGVDRWLDLTYADEALVTQLDGHTTPADVAFDATPVNSVPTSSASMPSVVAAMWEALGVSDGDRVLEVGTGTGYSTALGCHRLGDRGITSVEVDPDVAARARVALRGLGYHPQLIVGDGLLGADGRAPYDRVIATCSVRHIPPAWIRQSRPGTVIVAPILGSLWACALARVTVTDPGAGTAEGQFLAAVSFMPARSHDDNPVVIPDLSTPVSSERPTRVGPEVLSGQPPVGMVAQLATPFAQHVEFVDDDYPPHLLVRSDGAYAALRRDPATDGWIVRQGGDSAIWDAVEAAVLDWRKAGEPDLRQFRITVTPSAQTVAVAGRAVGELPL